MPFDYPTRAVVEQALLVFAALFPIVNPVGGAPVFLALTHGVSSTERAQLARRVAVNALVLVLASALVGGYVIEFFGLSVPVIQVGGGLLVCSVAWNLLRSEDTQSEVSVTAQSRAQLAARAFYPLTMPLTVGPGSIAVAITLGAAAPRTATGWAISALGAAAGAGLLALSIYFPFRHAERLSRALGRTGTVVLLRLSAFILLCIGVQIVWSGAFALLATIPGFRPR
ncbi:MAG: MarC family protein [Betaproteobacteria bacterium]|nr:MarC family protein [Betaproteobacteria bacterium]